MRLKSNEKRIELYTPNYCRLVVDNHFRTAPVHFTSRLGAVILQVEPPISGIAVELWHHDGAVATVNLLLTMLSNGTTGMLWSFSGNSALVALSPVWTFTLICWTGLAIIDWPRESAS